MKMKNKSRSGFVIKIDDKSKIEEVIFSSAGADIELEDRNFCEFIEEGSLEKYFSLLKKLKEKEVIFGEEINLVFNNKSETYLFILLNKPGDSNILMAANESEEMLKYYEELMKINNKYVNELRRNLKEKINDKDEDIYNEMSKLNNELVNLQRKLNKQNMLLEAEKEKYKVTLSSIAEGVISANSSSEIVYLNSKAEKMLNKSLEEAQGKKCSEVFKIAIREENNDLDIISEEIMQHEKIEVKLFELLKEKGEINNQEAFLLPEGGGEIPIEFSASLIKENQGKVIIFRNISDRKNTEERLKKYASTDLLTEVLNRRAGLDYLKEEMQRIEENEEQLSVIFIDVNDLKIVNDNFGHQEGDSLLQKISSILQHSLRKNDKVVRLGGDEFLLILPTSDKKAAEKIWARINEKLKAADRENKKDYKIWASHGVAEYSPDYNKTVDQLVNTADHNMYKEKEKLKAEK